ncbi:MAG: TolC family protein [Pirellulales bacterium]
MLVAGGCTPSQPFYFFDDGDMSHYKGVATAIEYPDVEMMSLADVEQSLPPLTLANSEAREIWELSLEEAVQDALANSKVMRTLGAQTIAQGRQGTSSPLTAGLSSSQLLSQPSTVPTVYNPAIVDSDPRFGTEGALSEFDAQFSTSMFWERNDRPVNLFFSGFLAPVLEQDTGVFRAEFGKRHASGTQTFLRHNVSYEWNNNPSNQFPSAYNADIEAEFRHPLLQGSGVQFNQIAGPNSIPGVYNGVVLARINTDIALADFEAGVRNLVSDVERAYWNLYFNYRDLDAALAGRDSALETWRKVDVLYRLGARGGDAAAEAQAKEQYFLFRLQVENALSSIYTAENQLRYLMGLSATDGRLIRPSIEPTTARVQFDWAEVLPETLTRSVELRRQKWQIKQRELELTASRNFLLPRLDAVGRYRWRGFGDDLISSDRTGIPFDNAWEELTGGDFQEWQLGLQAVLPIGFRQELAAVRNAELQLARERSILQDQELEASHLLANSIRELDRHYVATQTNFNRRVAAATNVDAVESAYEAGTVTLDLLLEAQRRLAEAESAYYRSLVDYNLAVTGVHFRKGSLLEYNGVYLAEGPWPAKAYFDARKRARERDAALFMDYGFTRPRVFSRGPFPQQMGTGELFEPQAAPRPEEAEMVPAPVPGRNGRPPVPADAPDAELGDSARSIFGAPPNAPPVALGGRTPSARRQAMQQSPLAGAAEGTASVQHVNHNRPSHTVARAAEPATSAWPRPQAAAADGWKGTSRQP